MVANPIFWIGIGFLTSGFVGGMLLAICDKIYKN